MDDIREKIKKIYSDDSLTPKEKTIKVQAIYSNRFKSPEKEKPTCTHYNRNCEIKATCCQKFYGCRLCHDQVEDHKIDRFKTEIIQCTQCFTEQGISNQCIKCGITFGESFCQICRMWTSDEIYHCNECGFCRKGKSQDFIHCQNCNACMAKSHQCHSTINKENKCPVCLELLFNSTDAFTVTKCGHSIHQKCFQKQLSKGLYQCPVCKKSLVDLSEHWNKLAEEIALVQMPEEYRDQDVSIHCNDCLETSTVKFHVLGMRCVCGSFNTTKN